MPPSTLSSARMIASDGPAGRPASIDVGQEALGGDHPGAARPDDLRDRGTVSVP